MGFLNWFNKKLNKFLNVEDIINIEVAIINKEIEKIKQTSKLDGATHRFLMKKIMKAKNAIDKENLIGLYQDLLISRVKWLEAKRKKILER